MKKKVPYSQIDHSHCWTSDKPPCGQKIEHLVCCLCGLSHPSIRSSLQSQADEYEREKRYEAVELATSLMFKLGTRPMADGIDRDYHQGLRDMRDAIAKAHGVDLSE